MCGSIKIYVAIPLSSDTIFFSFSFSIIEIADVNLWQIASLLNNLGKVHPLSCHLASPKSYYRYYISESILLQHQVH